MISNQENFNLSGKLDQILIDNKNTQFQVQQLINEVKEIKLHDVYNDVMDSNQAAKYLKITTRHLQTLRDDGEIIFSQRGTMIRFKKTDLDAWIEEYRVEKRR